MRKLLLAALAAVVATGCAGPIKNMRELPANAVVPTPSPDEALVVFLRPSGMAYRVQSSVFDVTGETPELVGIIAAKTKVAHKVAPGKHVFMVVGETGDFLEADLAAGKTYYALVEPQMGAWKARFTLVPVRREQIGTPDFEDWFDDCRLVARSPDSNLWANRNAVDIRAKHAKYYPEWTALPETEKPILKAEDGI